MKDTSCQNKIKLILETLLFLVGFSIPFSYAFNSISIGVLFIFSFYWFEKKNYQRAFKERNYSLFLFGIFYLIQIVGIFYSYNFELGFYNVTKSVVFILLPITFINISNILDYKKIILGVYGLVFGVFVILISAQINILNKIILENLSFYTLINHFVRVEFVSEALVEIHPPYFAMLTIFIIVPVILGVSFKNKIKNKLLIYALVCYLIFSLYSISSLMSFVLLAILICVYAIYLLKKGKWRFIFIFGLLFLGTLVLFNKSVYQKSINDFSAGTIFKRIDWIFLKDKGDTSRPHNWKSVLSVVNENLIFGVGSDGGVHQLQKYRNHNSESYINKHNAHNQYLEILLRHGLLGVIIYLLLIFSMIRNAILSKDIIFQWFLVVFLISSITESYLQRQIGLTFFCFYALMLNTFYTFVKPSLKKKVDEKSTSTRLVLHKRRR